MIFNYTAYTSERFHLAKVISLSKLANYFMARFSYYISIFLRRPVVWAGPFSVNIETSAICNLRCPECMAGTQKTLRKNRFISPDLFDLIIRFSPKTLFWCNLYFQGEPLLNKNIFDYITRARKQKLYTVISTNGHLLTPKNCEAIVNSGLSRIIISLDGAEKNAYKQYRRGGNFNKVIEGISQLALSKKKLGRNLPLIVVQFLVNRTNEHQLSDIKKLAKKLGADVLSLKSMQIYSNDGIKTLTPKKSEFNRYTASSAGNGAGKCFRLWSHMVFTSDGMWAPCCYDKIPQYAIKPNLLDDPYHVWRMEDIQNFRRNLLKRKQPEICKNCIG